MARAVVFTYPDPAGARPPVAIFAGLARGGEQLTVYASANQREAIEAAGAIYRAYPIARGGMLGRNEFAEEALPGVLEAVRTEQPDYLVLDAATPWGSAAAGLLGLPAASYRGLSVPDRAAGLECRCDLNLVLLSRALEPESVRFDQSFRFVGICPGDEPEQPGFPWNELGPDPLIYVPLDTVRDKRAEFFRACAEAFGGLPFEVVVSPGWDGAMEAAPANFLAAPFVPVRRLLEHTTLAIAGVDSAMVEECARAGVLQLLYPEGRGQFLLAGQVQQLGAGLRLEEADIEGGRLRELAGRVMARPDYCRAAEGLRESVRRSGGAAEACREILAFVARLHP